MRINTDKNNVLKDISVTRIPHAKLYTDITIPNRMFISKEMSGFAFEPQPVEFDLYAYTSGSNLENGNGGNLSCTAATTATTTGYP